MDLIKRQIKYAKEQDPDGEIKAALKNTPEENLRNYCIAIRMNFAFMGIDVSKKVLKRTIKYAE